MIVDVKVIRFIENTLQGGDEFPSTKLMKMALDKGFTRHQVRAALRVLPLVRTRKSNKYGDHYVLELVDHANARRKRTRIELVETLQCLSEALDDYGRMNSAYEDILAPIADWIRKRGVKQADKVKDPRSKPTITLAEYLAQELSELHKKQSPDDVQHPPVLMRPLSEKL